MTTPAPGGLPASVDALADAARDHLPGGVYDYFAGGAEDEVTLAGNRSAFRDWHLRPRRLVDVSEVDAGVEILGRRWSLPVALAPTAFQKLAHPEGELATARAAGRAGTLMIVSTVSTFTIEEIAEAATGPLWLQLYVFRERRVTEELVRRAEAAGVDAICLTVDVPVQGKRERDDRNRFRLPDGLRMENFRGLDQEAFPDGAEGSGLATFIHDQLDPSLGWEALGWLRGVTDLPVVLKGILTREDAGLAVEHGAAGVVVSNHGGRQLDGATPTLVALPEVVEGVEGRIPVLVDGGIRRGTDVVKALALGARGVCVGRPFVWGLALAGEAGVTHVLETLRDEVERTLRLLGRPRAEAVDADAVRPAR